MPTIGIVSSIPYEKSFKDALENNVNVTNVTFPNPQDDASDLAQAVQYHVKAGVNFIVTLGGVNPYNAAADTTNNPSIPFFSFMGETPQNPLPTNCWGGVSLESWAHNKDRVEYLIKKGYNKKAAISLYYNQNSGMANDEVNDWMNNLYPNHTTTNNDYVLVQNPIKAMTKDGTNDEKDIATTVGNIKSAAVIVSAVPFFHKKHDKLVGAINKTTLYACYPLQNYMSDNPQPNLTTLYGPTLEDGIKTLAGVITTGIKSKTKQSFTPQSLGNPVDITSPSLLKRILLWIQGYGLHPA